MGNKKHTPHEDSADSPASTLQVLDNRGGRATARRYARSLTEAARQGAPAEIMVEYLLALLQGHGDARWKPDARAASGWSVVWPEHGAASSDQQMAWAWTQLRQAGWGMPIQSHLVEADFVAQAASKPLASVSGMTPAQIVAVAKYLESLPEVARRALGSPGAIRDHDQGSVVTERHADANDAELVDSSEPAASAGDAGEDDESE